MTRTFLFLFLLDNHFRFFLTVFYSITFIYSHHLKYIFSFLTFFVREIFNVYFQHHVLITLIPAYSALSITHDSTPYLQCYTPHEVFCERFQHFNTLVFELIVFAVNKFFLLYNACYIYAILLFMSVSIFNYC